MTRARINPWDRGVRASSYQSRGLRWKWLVIVAAVGSLGAAPYVDTKGRFQLTPAEGWGLAPEFGDTFGMRFAKNLGRDQTATFLVHVDPASADDALGFADAIEELHSPERRFRRTAQKKLRVNGRPAIMRAYEAVGTTGRRVMVRAWYVGASGRFYHLRAWAPRGAMRTVEAEVEGMVRSFVPGRAEPVKSVATPPPVPTPLLGEWWNTEGVRVELAAGGSFELGDAGGSYTVEGRKLTLSPESGGTHRFRWSLVGDALELKSPKMKKAARYTRRAPETNDAMPPLGSWRAKTPNGPMILEISPNGEFTMGPLAGTWLVNGDKLVLTGKGGARVAYKFRRTKRRLTLSEGDLDEPLHMKRVGPR